MRFFENKELRIRFEPTMDMDMDMDVDDGAGSDATVEKLIAAGRVQEREMLEEQWDCEEGSVGATRRNRRRHRR